MTATLVFEQGWVWSLFSVLALIYGALILAAVIYFLIRAARLEESSDKDDLRFRGGSLASGPQRGTPDERLRD